MAIELCVTRIKEYAHAGSIEGFTQFVDDINRKTP
jgi:hypothetical protein